MQFFYLKKQTGAVLAFSLVMLLLLTLAATRMIQQNKQQLEMANNARLQTQAFADAEATLAYAKNIIDVNPAHIDPTSTPPSDDSHLCVPTSQYLQHILPSGKVSFPVSVTNASATILSTSCMTPSNMTKCTDYDGSKITCYPKSAGVSGVDCTGKTDNEIAALFTDPTDVCYQPYDPTCSNPNGGSDPNVTNNSNPDSNYNPNPRCSVTPPTPLPSPSCPKEVYKIDAIIKNSNGTTREIIADHVVGCGT